MFFPFLPVFGRGLGVDFVLMSRLMALRSASGVLSPFLALFGDIRGRKFGMLLGLVILIVGMLSVSVFPSLFTFFLALVLSFMGYFAFNPSMQAYLGDHIAYQQRGRALALTELGWSLSFIIGVPLMGLAIARFGWRSPFSIMAVLGIVASVILKARLPYDKPDPTHRPNLWKTSGLLLTSTAALAGVIMGAAFSMANELVTLVFGVWLEESFGLQVTALGATAALIGFAELGGELFSAGLVDRLGKIVSVMLGLILNCLAALALALLSHKLGIALACLFLFFLTFEFTIVSTIPVLTEILPEARATVMAVTITMVAVGRALGDLISPWLYEFGKHQEGLPVLLWVALGVIVLNLAAMMALFHLGRNLAFESPPVST